MNTHVPRVGLIRNSRVLRRADEIIDAAARVFAERGYHGASTQDIADVIGLRQASLYYYFTSKEAALELVCARGVDGFVESAEAIVHGNAPPLQQLAGLIASHLAPIESKRDYVKVFINERRYLPQPARRRIGRKSRRIERCFERVVQAGIDDGTVRGNGDVRLTALAVLGMCNAVINWRSTDQSVDVRTIAGAFVSLVANGLAAGGSVAARRRGDRGAP